MNWIIDNIIVRTLDMHGSIGLTSPSSRASHQQHALFGPVRSNSEWRARARRPTPVSVVPSADGVGVYWSGTIHGPGTPSRPGPFFVCRVWRRMHVTQRLTYRWRTDDRRYAWIGIYAIAGTACVCAQSVCCRCDCEASHSVMQEDHRELDLAGGPGSWWDVVLASFRLHHEFVTHVHMAIYACREPFWARLTFLYGDGGWPPSEER